MITIEAENSPADGEQPNQEEGEKPIEREAGSLNFLSTEEQARVQRLLNLCEFEEKVETSTQTVDESSATPQVATSCNCENQIRQLLENQEEMKRMWMWKTLFSDDLRRRPYPTASVCPRTRTARTADAQRTHSARTAPAQRPHNRRTVPAQ